ncbi:MAG TPA: host attachment protein [Kofleriaceae bacterium]|jgi:protein required for attachment to host cells
MNRACIAIVDGARARIYSYDRTAGSDAVRSAPVGVLHEVVDLRAAATEDHRDPHTAQSERRFAGQVIAALARMTREQAFDHVLVVAPPVMLGALRGVAGELQRPELVVDYVARDLARLTSPQIHDHLAQLRLVAPRRSEVAPG